MRKRAACLYCEGDERCMYCRGSGVLPEISESDLEKLRPRDSVADALNEMFGIRLVSLDPSPQPSARQIEDLHYRAWDQQRFRRLAEKWRQKIITVDEIRMERREGLAFWRAASESGPDEIQ